MFKYFILLSLSVFVFSLTDSSQFFTYEAPPQAQPLKVLKQAESIRELSADPKAAWKPKLYADFEGKTLGEIKKQFLGFVAPVKAVEAKLKTIGELKGSNTLSASKTAVGTALPPKEIISESFLESHSETTQLPTSFNAYNKWWGCQSIVQIRNQGGCGSCWAFSSASVISDRTCIYGKGNYEYSAVQLAGCSRPNGCDGGWMSEAFTFWRDFGTVTEKCQPYQIPIYCNKASCPGNTYLNHAWDKHQGDKTWGMYKIASTEAEMMNEIYLRGPITAAFDVYQDFMSYSSGVYVKKSNVYAGGHAIKIIGWGVENGVKFWLCVNSWGNGWGLKGMFKFLRGSNHCNIESYHLVTGIPVL